jgi:hypothetical protein
MVSNEDFLLEFPIGSYVKLSSAVAAILVAGLKCRRPPVSKMAAITKNRNFFKWQKLLYFKPESAQI